MAILKNTVIIGDANVTGQVQTNNISAQQATFTGSLSVNGLTDVSSLQVNSTAVAVAANDAIVIGDNSDSNKIKRSTTVFGNASGQFLRNDGTWQAVVTNNVSTGISTTSPSPDELPTSKAVSDYVNIIEEIIATNYAVLTTATGINTDYTITWSASSGISSNASTLRAGIEEVASRTDSDEKVLVSASTATAYLSGALSTSTTSQQYVNVNVYMNNGELYAYKMHASQGFFQDSDKNKKNIISDIPLEKAYDLIDKCQTIIYTLKMDETNKEQIGMIAQEVQEFFPEVVSLDNDGYLSLDYSRLTVVILKVLKDLIKRLNNIETKIKES